MSETMTYDQLNELVHKCGDAIDEALPKDAAAVDRTDLNDCLSSFLQDMGVSFDDGEGSDEEPDEEEPCRGCGADGATFAPDPYAQDINGNDTPVWMCAECRSRSSDEI